jgi:hypothetical protein
MNIKRTHDRIGTSSSSKVLNDPRALTRPCREGPTTFYLYGAPWLQPMASGGKCGGAETGSVGEKPLPYVATGCGKERMVRTVSATACNRLPMFPLCKGGGRPFLALFARGYFLLLQSGHGQWSQPQPVHAARIVPGILSRVTAAAGFQVTAAPPLADSRTHVSLRSGAF